MHQTLCRECFREAVAGLAYCMDCEPAVKRQQQAERDQFDEQIERWELERMYNA